MNHKILWGFLGASLWLTACGPAMVYQDPVSGSWAYYAAKDPKTQTHHEQGIVYLGHDKKPLTPSEKEQRYYATSGFVDGVAIIAQCTQRFEDGSCQNIDMAVMDQNGRLLNAFGEFDYPQLMVSNEFPAKILHVDLTNIREMFPLWQGMTDQGAEKTRYILFYNDRMVIKQNGVFGFMDRSGRAAVAPRFLAVSDFDNGEARVISDVGIGTIDLIGQFTQDKYACIIENNDNLKRINIGGRLVNYSKDLRTKTGMYISDTLQSFTANHPQAEEICTGGKWGLLDADNNEIVPAAYNSIINSENGKYFMAKDDEKDVVAIYDKLGNLIVAPEYKAAYLGDFFFVVQNADGKFALMDINGKRTTEFEYEEIISKTREDTIGDYMLSEYAVAKKDGKWGVVAPDGTVKIPFEYDTMGPESEQIIAYQRGSKWGALDIDGKVFLSPIYGSLGTFDNGRAPATLADEQIYVYRDEKSRAAWLEKARLEKERLEYENRLAAEESRKRQEQLARQRLEEERKQSAYMLNAERARIQKEIDRIDVRIEVLEPQYNVSKNENMGAELEQLRLDREALIQQIHALENPNLR